MSQDLTATIPENEFHKLVALDTGSLKAELAATLSMTAAQLLRLATIVRILEDRGEDLTELRIGMLGYLRRIASGQILPEVVVRFGEFPSLVQRVGNLPLQEQRKLAGGEPVKLLVYRDTGPEHRLLDPLKLTGDQVLQVFARDHIRDDAEQIAIIESRRTKKERKPKRSPVRADRERDGLVVGKKFISRSEVLLALAELSDPDYDENTEDETSSLVLQLPVATHRQLKIISAKSGVPMATLAKRAIAAAGLTTKRATD